MQNEPINNPQQPPKKEQDTDALPLQDDEGGSLPDSEETALTEEEEYDNDLSLK